VTRKKSARELSKEQSREALLEAGAAEFAARGVDAPSLDDICARAGYTRGAFYVHWDDRDDFMVAVMERAMGGFLDALTRAGGGEPGLAAIVEGFARAVASGGSALGGRGEVRLTELLQACARSSRVRKRLVALLEEAIRRVGVAIEADQRRGALRRDVDPGLTAALLVALVLGVQVLGETRVELDVAAGAAAAMTLLSATGAKGSS
jgi:AcrR family transcriptional regulator